VETVVLWPFLVYLISAVGIVAGMVIVSALLGERHSEHATGKPYESGVVSTGGARVRFSNKFYLVAVFFVIFDLEAVYLFAWATSVLELGWLGYIEVLIFVGILMAALVYLWRVGGLDYGPRGRQPKQLKG
jgi:NADH-quinone oxidoreductase subunit A